MILLKRVSLIPLYGYLNIRVHLKHGNKQLIEASILHAADRAKPFLLSTDARGVGIGAVLEQDSEKGIVPVAFYSRKLKQCERKYEITELESYMIIDVVVRDT